MRNRCGAKRCLSCGTRRTNSAARSAWLAGLAVASLATLAVAEDYYVSNAGDDRNDGRSPDKPWRTIVRVNAHPLQPGDVVRLKRGDSWREQLVPRSGGEKGHVTYSAYGSGDKPLLLGSVEKNDPKDWTRDSGNIWVTTQPTATGKELLKNPSFAADLAEWNLHYEQGAKAVLARDTADADSPPAACRVTCAKPGQSGSHIQLYTSGMAIEQGKVYRLIFRAKSTKPFVLNYPNLMSSGPPWIGYTSSRWLGRKQITTEWATGEKFYKAGVTAKDARLTFFLGDAFPEGAILHLDSLSFAECEGSGLLTSDVGNIIFDGEKSCGVKKFKESELKTQGDYWYDEDAHVVKLCSAKNPAEHYADIECAIREHVIDQSGKCYVVYELLAVKYGAAHGIGGGSTHHIIVRDCDFAYIGGGDQSGGEHTVRFGNGVEFWGTAHDCLVERCRLWEIYDAALTNQSSGPNTPQINIVYRNNLIWNSEYSFEYWNRPEKSETRNVRFENNTCLFAGYGWGHTQRPDPSGRHLCFYTSPARATDICVRNNVFFEAKGNAFFCWTWPRQAILDLKIDHNAWHQSSGAMVRFWNKDKAKDASYEMARFQAYQKDWGMEPHSIVADPDLVDPTKADLHLKKGSPCIDAGGDYGLKADFEGTPRPQGKATDIGAYEFKQ
ncbi:MAG: carbohydrate binding domain-containing protein [Phycisphaerae bacterium]|nr:carbohydrate binding domain-containing protein [Phycisphaerae bacterium]